MSINHNYDQNIPLVKKSYELYKKTHHYLKSFPKQERYSLGQKIQNMILELLCGLITVNQLPKILREDLLIKLNSQNELLKLLFRLSHEIKVLDMKKYLSAESDCQEIGKMIGGWIKYLKSER